jgi:hypothetical protein
VLASVLALPPLLLTAVLLLARAVAAQYKVPCASVSAILAATNTSKSRAYELVAELAALLPTLVRGPGRPARAPSSPASEAPELTRAVLDYVMAHPGCAHRGVERQRYADGFRRFVLDLQASHAQVELDVFARAVAVPLGTLKDWLSDPRSHLPSEPNVATKRPPPPESRAVEAAHPVEATHIQTVLDAWSRWNGSFLDFCEHVRRDLRVPYGRDLVRRILEVEGRREPARRKGRHGADEIALRGAFRTYFPGAEWVGDGMQVPVIVSGHRFVFNVELDVDAYAGAFVGVSVRDTEDSAAVVDAFASGVATTGTPPLALLLDNKPSNHTPDIDAALGDTIRIRATPQRPQNKAHVEGAFGLFSQVLPPLMVDARSGAHDLARQFLELVVGVWARTTNHRPRRDRAGRSRIELYSDTPTDEQIELARRELRELADRQELARRTLEARRRPEVLALLDDYFARHGLLDPERHIRIAIAAYSKNAIVDGMAIFDSKRRADTLPDGADARYLLGIVKNIAAKTEGEYLAELLYAYRMEARDRFLAPLRAEREALRSEHDVGRVLGTYVDRALETPSNLERTFWLDVIVETLREQPEPERELRFRYVARIIEATFAVTPRERHDAVRFIADRIVLIE